jgi:hypothetical protein
MSKDARFFVRIISSSRAVKDDDAPANPFSEPARRERRLEPHPGSENEMNLDRTLSTMPRYAFLALALASVAVGCAAPTGDAPSEAPAQAQEGLAIATRVFASENPTDAYAALRDEERAKFDGVTTPGELQMSETFVDMGGKEITPESTMTPAYSGCYGWHQTYGRKALFGNTLYTYWQSTSVCVSNGTVTSVSVYDAGGETSTPGWRITHSPTTATKNVYWEGRGKAQYYFVFGAGGWDIQHPTDCIQQRLNGNGHDHVSSSSCDLG